MVLLIVGGGGHRPRRAAPVGVPPTGDKYRHFLIIILQLYFSCNLLLSLILIVMSKKDKLIERFLTRPKDFIYDELRSLLNGLGYFESNKGKTSDSRVAFVNKKNFHIIRLHKPHPKNILKIYQVDLIIEELQKENFL